MTQDTIPVALVTGGSRGIGRAISLRLAQDGFAIAVNYAGNAQAAQATVQAIQAAGGRAMAVQGDVADPAAVASMFDAAQAFGPLQVVVNSAGVMAMAPIDSAQVGSFDRMIATNLRGAFLVLAEAARRLEEGGRIIALSSSVIAKAFPGYGPYIASKAGVEGLVKVLANELRGRGITANVIAPGPVETELFLNGKSAETLEQIAQMAPMQRIGQPEEIAGAVAFLAGPDGQWVNAQVLRVNGGMA
ncbi:MULTISPECIES: SDR family oxidoreductase [unclassified Pseudomonas]|uniref:SDR family oxidoreductase n=1 Tax=unclassified Pseudomonas TaxID=196821 RepID=UPI000BCE4347|nr:MULTISPECIES: SDR family oxidoreductase [unclassified Pseudomonas]PVZ16137.1 3-oxoacyl-[acyl-carrier protein] reductase [Pseudomonas sp. URIL14HWK12:I12]PVZ26007.1 3-oxoacyl-[acyl-carrier protein] reductase [Pseudomonas sp. URIL14HWK12:I10]PVZ36469.1 3-oxoacyl-[acyl-carrier protein] reductase [Pseudomonas sp. URIL14HWK12:I11]SNZ18531.1 3-oxoacyl-[acyl-carrier protein] reductase [Pseudomonas sp. URIL14HWK12:I9]